MVSSFFQSSVVTVMVSSGTLVSIVMKILYDTTAVGRDGVEKKFKKPWCAMMLMSLAMATTLLKFAYERRRDRAAAARDVTTTTTEVVGSLRMVALRIAIPAFLCLFGTFLQSCALLWIPVSIYQMLQSSVIIFAALVRFLWMGKSIARHEACGILLVALGLSSVGLASILAGKGATSEAPLYLQVVGMCMVLISQAFLAVSSVIEERLLQGCGASAEFVCGMVGCWGMLYCLLIFLPLAQNFPGADGNGLREDSIDTLYMVKNSSSLQMLLAAFFVVILAYNLSMRTLNKISQATTMQLLGGLRTLSVWAVALLMYFHWPQYGEKWVWSTWIELAGFLVLICGVFMYRATFRFPCFVYPDALLVAKSPATSIESQVDDAGLASTLVEN
jgi:hypothetical protein